MYPENKMFDICLVDCMPLCKHYIFDGEAVYCNLGIDGPKILVCPKKEPMMLSRFDMKYIKEFMSTVDLYGEL